jgi:hypothetical protein
MVVANSRHVLWRISHIRVISSTVVLISHVTVDFIILKLLMLVFSNDFLVVVMRTSLHKCIGCWHSHDFSS